MADIDIGPACIDRASTLGPYTIIVKDNPANAAGKITKVWIWCQTSLVNAEVATFYETNGNTFSTRDTEAIGAVVAGAAREFAVNLDVEIGDYIGIYYTGGALERSTSGYAGAWYKAGDNIPCTTTVFPVLANEAYSLYGEGEVPAPPAKKTLVQAALISIPPLIVLPTLGQILKLTGGC